MAELFGRLRGGLGFSVTLVGMLLAASTGIVGATVVTMGLLSLPTMLRRGYDPRIASGVICASGTLGQIIPPSIVLVLLGDVLSSAYQQAQLDMGIYSPETVSVGDLFSGALIPGLILVSALPAVSRHLSPGHARRPCRPSSLTPGATRGSLLPACRLQPATTAAADCCRARLDPGGYCHTDRGRLGGRRRCHAAGACRGASARWASSRR